MAVDANRLWERLREQPADQAMAIADLFALGCLMRLQGHHKAGNTAVETALKLVRGNGNASYCDALYAALPGNEELFAKQVNAHLEINHLVRGQAEQNADRPSAECEG
ncbi:hypothetical protein PRZ61_03625 [Halomonas pacifica]|uniref:hypothetical protein n=1 Tax=Bisbaumannia pacifica TaxID=77098 RepID=UPI002358EF2C|nr:hypothetical protein [Halomonas pacifica]MDC8802538.1 hypothetical protein [Halomonas pacifica]